MRQIKRIFVHCTAGSQKTTLKQLEQEFKNKGWKNPGYHYVVFPDGKIEQMLDENLVSNGVAGYNSSSINVAYIGGVDSKLKPIDNRTEAQKASLKQLLIDLKASYPDAHIMGHRDIWGKDSSKWQKWCPCFDAEAEYASLGNPDLIPEEPEGDEEDDEEETEKAKKIIEGLASLGYTEEEIFEGGKSLEEKAEELKEKELTKEDPDVNTEPLEQPKKDPWWDRFLAKWKKILKFLRLI